jgi:tetratricopeptide (TPR) repeat protein
VAQSLRCGQLYLGVFAVLVVLAYLTTSWFYSLPGRAAGIDARLARGYDKFGGRMEKAGRWQAAADLYLSGFALGPQNLPMLHKAMDVFQAEGDEGSYQKYYRIMLDTTAAELRANDASVENLLMLAANYAEIDAQAVAHELLAQALTTAAQRVAASPNESDAYYWLGRAYQQRGDYGEARRAYEQAKAMEPSRGRYILALRLLNNIQPEN